MATDYSKLRATGPDGAHARLPYGVFFGCFRQEVHVDGFTVARVGADPRGDVPRHTHDAGHFIFLVSGAYLTAARGAGPECTRPTLIYNPPGTTHQDRFRRTDGQFDGRFWSVSIDPERMRRIAEQVPLVDQATCGREPQAVGLAARLVRECRAWAPCSPLVAEAICMELTACVARAAAPVIAAPPGWLRVARELLHDCCGDRLTVYDVARTCGVHPVHLARVFRRHVGCSPGTYLRQCRLDRAAALLREGGTSLSEVALASGFADHSHLSKTFRRLRGVTPSRFRQLLCQDV